MVNGCHSLALRSARIRSIIRYGYAQKGTPTRMAASVTDPRGTGGRIRGRGTTTRTRTKRPVRSSVALKADAIESSPKIDALRQYREEILEAPRSGLSFHRIAQIFRERGVDISVPHLVRTVRRFVDERRAGPRVRVPLLRAVQRVP
jgi:hypothetical protein